MRAPYQLIIEGPIPGAGSERPLTPSEAKCVENLRKAGKKAVVGGKITEAILHYLSAADTAVAQAGETYLDLASVLDQASYPQPAVIAYRKAWMAFEAGQICGASRSKGQVCSPLPISGTPSSGSAGSCRLRPASLGRSWWAIPRAKSWRSTSRKPCLPWLLRRAR